LCPQKAIIVEIDANGFYIPSVNENLCIDCGLCYKKCPETLLCKNEKGQEKQEIYAVSLKDKAIKKRSSSGGAFFWIAEYILSNNGIVYGATFDVSDRTVKHCRVDSVDDLGLLQNSKYVQSKLGDSYLQIKHDLQSGKKVLFSGTPCQIAGAYSVIGRHDNFYTCDILCYGVPSPMVLNSYLKETVGNSEIKSFNMRDKTLGWVNYSMRIETDESVYISDKYTDVFHKGFQTHLFYRESCYNCHYRKKERLGDITLGDFWDIKERFTRGCLRNDDSGISFVMVNTEKGGKLLHSADKTKVWIESREFKDNSLNFGFGKEMQISEDRTQFFNKLKTQGYSVAIEPFVQNESTYHNPTLVKKIYRWIKKHYVARLILHKLGIPV
jgi:coenzyme F420-reducing hydrogenase beta subunit